MQKVLLERTVNITSIVILLLSIIVSGPVFGKDRGTGSTRTVRIRLADDGIVPSRILSGATAITRRIFSRIGVDVQWELAKMEALSSPVPLDPNCPMSRNLEVIEVLVLSAARKDQQGLAHALPFSRGGARVTIHYDRVVPITYPDNPLRSTAIFGHVLAHEIAHVLLGNVSHAPAGLMREKWSAEEVNKMLSTDLEFTAGDATTIRNNLDRQGLASCGDRLAVSE